MWGAPHHEERGVTVVTTAFAMVVLLSMSALAIDLAFLYVGRSEAQRAADAAALAGAKQFVDSGFTSGVIPQAAVKTLATQAAEAVGSQNFVGGQPAVILDTDVTFDFSIPNDPRITVTVARDANHPGGPLPTFFAKVFGVHSANVSAKATAEAYNPLTGTGPPVGYTCLKPWLLPNCDPDPSHTTPVNPNCPGGPSAKFVDPKNCANTAVPEICYPGAVKRGGVIGQKMTIKPGSPSQPSGPSKYYEVYLPPGPNPPPCPACAKGGGGGGGLPSGATYRQNIECCNTNPIPCGSQTIQPIVGNKVGPTRQGVDCLIHQPGQDVLDTSVTPFRIIGGSNNPNPALRGVKGMTSSDSIVTIPLYDGSTLCPGMACQPTVNVVGFLEVFIKDETSPQGTVEAYILNVSGCGGGGSSGGSTPPPLMGASSVPIRLIRNP